MKPQKSFARELKAVKQGQRTLTTVSKRPFRDGSFFHERGCRVNPEKIWTNQEQREARLIDITKNHAFLLIYQTPDGALRSLSNIIPPEESDRVEFIKGFLLEALQGGVE